MDTLHERVYELSSEHIKTVNALADKYGRYADSSPDTVWFYFEVLRVNYIEDSRLSSLI